MDRRRKQTASAASARGGAPAYPVESVDSALRILAMLCEEREVRISEVAAKLGVAHSTAHRLLSTLVHHRFAVQEGRGREYRTGPALLEMGFAAIRDMEVRRHARPILQAVRDKVGETVHLAIPYGREILYVESVESRHPLRIASRVGTFVPAHCIAAGKALLATLSREELLELFPANKLPTITVGSVATLEELDKQLEKIRRSGFARSRAESDDGVGSIAVALTDRRGIGRAAISISAPITRIVPEAEARWIQAATEAATALKARLWGPLHVV